MGTSRYVNILIIHIRTLFHFLKSLFCKIVNDGGSPITGYIIEKKEPGGKWVKAADVKGKDCSGTVDGLEPGQTYEFRVKAVNAAGPGDPSGASKPVTAKPRKLAPKIDRKNLNKITVREGEPFFFDAKVTGEPPPTCTWTLNGKPVDETSDKRTENVPYYTKFKNDNPKRADSGTYTITASNQWGEDSAEVQVLVVSKPGKPEGWAYFLIFLAFTRTFFVKMPLFFIHS